MNDPRIVVCLCECGSNIAGPLDLDAIGEWAAGQPGVVRVVRHALLCSPAGRAFFEETARELQADSMVVAACTPKMHDRTFQEAAEAAGLNLANVQMANVREHCAWVTPDRRQATDKAIALIRAALQRIRGAAALERRTMEAQTDIVVIGGGIAGIEAALSAARDGRRVTLIERDIAVGGQVIRVEEVAPQMACSPCLLAPRLQALRDTANIEVLASAEVTEVLGFYGNFTVRARQQPRFVSDSCIGCEACFEVCPVDTASEFHLGLGTRKAIRTLYPGSVPSTAAIDPEACLHLNGGDCEACVGACPFGSIDFTQQARDVEVPAGAILVATGFGQPAPESLARYGYGVLDNVRTLPELERLASSNGPTGSQVLCRNGAPPESVAVIHCAGSLCVEGLPYCSGTCCLGALKAGHIIRHQVSNATVDHVFRDLVLDTAAQRRFHQKQVEAGSRFHRCDDLASVRVTARGEQLEVTGPGLTPLVVDMVVLATGLPPAAGTAALAELLNVELDPNGFFATPDPALQPTGASLDGIRLAGGAAGPRDVPEAVVTAQAAAGEAVSRLRPGQLIELETMTSVIAEETCSGCKLCVAVCPYHAVAYDAEAAVCRINEAICRGCGTCTANCPTGASTARHYTNDQIRAEIGGLIHA